MMKDQVTHLMNFFCEQNIKALKKSKIAEESKPDSKIARPL